MSQDNEIRIRTVYNGGIMITYILPTIILEEFYKEIREICKFTNEQPFTIKWIDEDNDPCTISSQEELDEALRLYEVNHDSELTLHIFPNVPPAPGMPCVGEDKSIYRRGAGRWKRGKKYMVNGHEFEAKRFNRRAYCALCVDRIWGLGRQGFKCCKCKLLVHKKCHKLTKIPCGIVQPTRIPYNRDSVQGTPIPSRKQDVVNGERDSCSMNSEWASMKSYVVVKGKGQPQKSINENEISQDIDQASKDYDQEPHQYTLDDFDLLRVIGRGSYAKVLMVELRTTKRVYAMKVIKKELVSDEEDIDWIQTEKHVFETASNYPFLVGLHSCFQTPSRLFFVIEFVRGGDLMYHMQRQRRLPEEHARFYSAEISLALNYLHERGIIYRDLKLDNVLLDHEGHIKLTDYGMCKEGIAPGDTTSTFCGTPNYIAPEILRGEDYDFLLIAENPDQNTEDFLFQVILDKTIRIPRSISVKAQAVLKGFLNKNPAERLGCHSQSGFTDITSHPFFKSIDWNLLEGKQVPPPYKPKLETDRDLEHFDPQFTSEPVVLTPDDLKEIEKIDQSEFEGFEYINPLLMSMEDCV
ncbi:atypical protein kinase C [Caerostris extrusa]|uniref:Protein kinase C n=1 Tax=Caerostris extrusa TaxID=172846 RepID=A0AAV4PXZ6_CAEEX|nr:atypical protein kinase C [Caerostris extrusa]